MKIMHDNNNKLNNNINNISIYIMTSKIIEILNKTLSEYTLEQRIDLYKEVFNITYNSEDGIKSTGSADFFSNIIIDGDDDDDNDNNKFNESDIDPLLKTQIVIDDILSSNKFCLMIFRYYCLQNKQFDCYTQLKPLEQIISMLIKNNYVKDFFFDPYVTKSKLIQKILTINDDVALLMLNSHKMSFSVFCSVVNKDWMYTLNKVAFQYINEYIKIKESNFSQIVNIMQFIKNNEEFKNSINEYSLEILINNLSTLTYSFQKTSTDKSNNMDFYCELLIDFLSSDIIKPKIILDMFYENNQNIKMKDVLNNTNNKNKFINRFDRIAPSVLTWLCESKGSSITKICLNQLLENFFSENDEYSTYSTYSDIINNKNYCINFLILLRITQNTVNDLLENEKISKQKIDSVLSLICSSYSTDLDIINQLTLNLIDDFNLYEFVQPSIINSLGYKILSTYYKCPSDSKLEVYPVSIVTQIILANIEFIDYATIITLLCNLYKENLSDVVEQQKLDTFCCSIKQYIEKYNIQDTAKLLIHLIISKKASVGFLETYFSTVPEVKSYLVSLLCSKIYAELKIQKFATDVATANSNSTANSTSSVKNNPNVSSSTSSASSYYIDSPLISVYNMLTTHHNESISVKLEGMDSDNVNTQALIGMINCKSFTDYSIEKNVCKICFTDQCDIVLTPCGHVLCEKCSNEIIKHKFKCPFCIASNVVPIKMYYA